MSSFIRFVALTAMAITGLFASANALAQQPNFDLPFQCQQSWPGTSDWDSYAPLAIEFVRPGAIVPEQALASAAGTVVYTFTANNGNLVIVLDHGNRWSTVYGNIAQSFVQLGDAIDRGEPLGVIGKVSPEQHYMNYLYYEQDYYGMPWFASFNGEEAYYWGTREYVSQNGCQP